VTVVLATDHPAPDVDVELEELARIGARLLVATTGDEAELTELARDADAILTCFKLVTPKVVQAATHLRVIGRYGVGVDNIAVSEASARGIPVTNVPDYCVDEVAEHVIALLLALARKLLPYDAALRRGEWSIASGMPIHRIAGSTLGIVGFGRIGRAVAVRAGGLRMHVLAHDPNLPTEAISRAGAEPVELNDLLVRSDYVTLHVSLGPSTHHLLDAARLALMKPGAFIVNASRGAVIDLEALAAALREGRVAGAGLDVFEPERLPPTHSLFGAPGLVLTPHVAFYSEESMVELRRRATRNVVAVLAGERPESVVNPEVFARPG
jgi:D-3-phosphoglycerate dehydrogenase / 2-oxoglutarate reductase